MLSHISTPPPDHAPVFVVRNVAKIIVSTVLYSISKFYSRIILKKLSVGQLLLLWKVKDVMRLYAKNTADISFLKTFVVVTKPIQAL